jgi:DNA-binding Lrp family transcriptional regulator
MISAVVLIEAEPSKLTELAEALVTLDGVSEAYSVTGEYDLVAMVRVREHEDLAEVVTNGIAKLDGISHTQTLVAFRVHRDADWDWEIT